MNHEIHETHEQIGPLNQTILSQAKILFKEDCFAIQGAITNDEHRAQLFNYLKATSLRVGLLANFDHFPKATIERIIL